MKPLNHFYSIKPHEQTYEAVTTLFPKLLHLWFEVRDKQRLPILCKVYHWQMLNWDY